MNRKAETELLIIVFKMILLAILLSVFVSIIEYLGNASDEAKKACNTTVKQKMHKKYVSNQKNSKKLEKQRIGNKK